MLREVCGDFGLVAEVFVGVAVGAIDHEGGSCLFGLEGLLDFGDVFGIVVGPGFAAAEDEVAGGVAGCCDDCGYALFGDREEVVGV